MKVSIILFSASSLLFSIVCSFNYNTALLDHQQRYLLDCLQSVPQCSSCSSDKLQCQSCNSGYCLNSSSQCYQYKIDNCQSCSLQKCSTCDSGHYSSDNNTKCISYVEAIAQFIAILVGSLVGLFIIITLYRRCCRDRPSSRSNSYLQNLRAIPPASSNSLGPNFEIMENQRNIGQISWQIMKQKEGNDTCTICLSGCGNAKTQCGHLYHISCLKEWMKRSPLCPVCRSSAFNTIKIICNKCRQYSFQSSMNRQIFIKRRDDMACNRCAQIGEGI